MIKEAYVSFEVAKLLKEKGFNEPCRTWYGVETIQHTFDNSICNKYIDANSRYGIISAPTQQMTMAWLREKTVYISIFPDIELNFIKWNYHIYIGDTLIFEKMSYNYGSYEKLLKQHLNIHSKI